MLLSIFSNTCFDFTYPWWPTIEEEVTWFNTIDGSICVGDIWSFAKERPITRTFQIVSSIHERKQSQVTTFGHMTWIYPYKTVHLPSQKFWNTWKFYLLLELRTNNTWILCSRCILQLDFLLSNTGGLIVACWIWFMSLWASK